MTSSSSTPPSKRLKLESPPSPSIKVEEVEEIEGSEEDEDRCSICLQPIIDRTIIPPCAHEFCFDCLIVWSKQSRRCPLCSQSIGEYLIHNIRSRYDYQKRYLTPLRTSPAPLLPLVRTGPPSRTQHRRRERERVWGRREREERERDRLDRSIEQRRWIYEHDLYAKHVASNSHTRYRPYPSPQQFAASPELISRTTSFLRRELRIWVNLDVEFLTTFVISLMKAIDIRAESAVKLLAEFLDLDAPYVEGGRHVNAEHFAHEVYCYVRSPYKDLFVYDTVVQYDTPPNVSPPAQGSRRRRDISSSSSRSRHRSRSRSRSLSWSPSGRSYPSDRQTEPDQRVSTSGRRRRSARRNSSSRNGSPERRDTGKGHQRDKDVVSEGEGLAVEDEVHDTRPVPSPQALFQVRDPKGKRRADDDVPRAAEVSNELDMDTIEKSSLATLSTSADLAQSTSSIGQPRVDRRRPPRVRNLLQSVHAHLALGSTSHTDPCATKKTRNSPSSSQQTKAASLPSQSTSSNEQLVPSLLSRLSDTYIGGLSSPSQPDVSDRSDRLKLSAPDIMGGAAINQAKENASGGPQRPDVMSPSLQSCNGHQDTNTSIADRKARTLARLARLKGETTDMEDPYESLPSSSSSRSVAGDPSQHDHLGESPFVGDANVTGSWAPSKRVNESKSATTLTQSLFRMGRVESSPQPSTIAEFEADIDHDDGSMSASFAELPPPLHLDLRTQLLNRLEEERKKVQMTVSQASTSSGSLRDGDGDTTVPDSNTDLIPPRDRVAESGSDASVDSRAIEAKLRTRAQLRVRLAAEKRSVGFSGS